MTTLDAESIFAYAECWWKQFRPPNWTEKQHLDYPTLHCRTQDDEVFARYVADMIKRRNKGDK